MNVISYSVRETVGGAVEDPIIRAGICRLIHGTDDLVRWSSVDRFARRTFGRSVRLDNRTVRRAIGGNRHAFDDGAVVIQTRSAHSINRSCQAWVGDAQPVDYPIGDAWKAPSVSGCIDRAAGLGNTASIDYLIGCQARNRHTPSIIYLVCDPAGWRRLRPRAATRPRVGLAPALPELHALLFGGRR